MVDSEQHLWARVDVGHLAVLRELAEHGSVTAVARATTLSPSAVSQQLKVLQRRLGVVLVERAGRGVRLTDAGRALAGIAATISTALATAEADWQRYRGGFGGNYLFAAAPARYRDGLYQWWNHQMHVYEWPKLTGWPKASRHMTVMRGLWGRILFHDPAVPMLEPIIDNETAYQGSFRPARK